MTDAVPNNEFVPRVLTLRDGSQVSLRAVGADDSGMLQAAIRALSAESRYSRFMSALRELTPQMLNRAVHPARGRELQIVAVSGGGGDQTIVAGTRYVATAV